MEAKSMRKLMVPRGDIPCRVCNAVAGEPCRYARIPSRIGERMLGYHDERKHTDFPLAVAAQKALLEAFE
jgi:hypothetical protein